MYFMVLVIWYLMILFGCIWGKPGPCTSYFLCCYLQVHQILFLCFLGWTSDQKSSSCTAQSCMVHRHTAHCTARPSPAPMIVRRMLSSLTALGLPETHRSWVFSITLWKGITCAVADPKDEVIIWDPDQSIAGEWHHRHGRFLVWMSFLEILELGR